jgi:hypothetical protein
MFNAFYVIMELWLLKRQKYVGDIHHLTKCDAIYLFDYLFFILFKIN